MKWRIDYSRDAEKFVQKQNIRRKYKNIGTTPLFSIFYEECERIGTLEDVLEESGFSKVNDFWESRKPIDREDLALAL